MHGGSDVGRLDRLTFKGNLEHTRYGWLRLTPAYSVHQVSDLIAAHADADAVFLDPFCGTGTTALVCAERGIACDTTDINPFLVWLATVKARAYSSETVDVVRSAAEEIASVIRAATGPQWTPPLHQIEKWWDPGTLASLGRAMSALRDLPESLPRDAVDLLQIAFCRTMIGRANVSFGHQSMSFKNGRGAAQQASLECDEALTETFWREAVTSILASAQSPVAKQPRAILCDARQLRSTLPENFYSCVVTSPPYPNRMSYIRELRPYMYWLGFLEDGRSAGELDWEAIGGTWGCATSNVAKWQPSAPREIPYVGFASILSEIGRSSPLLSRYVHKYFFDMVSHCEQLYRVVRPGGVVNYIVGNSKFYDVLLPVQDIFAEMFAAAGFEAPTTQVIRKRTSKKELFEYLVSARKPG